MIAPYATTMSDRLLTLRPGLDSSRAVDPDSAPTDPLPARYSVALHEAICKAVMAGNNPPTAAVAAGLPRSAYYAWAASVKEGTAHPAIMKFFEDIDRSYAMAEMSAVATITEAETNRAENAKWLLRAGRAKDWGDRLIVENELKVVFDRVDSEFKNEPQLLARFYRALSEG